MLRPPTTPRGPAPRSPPPAEGAAWNRRRRSRRSWGAAARLASQSSSCRFGIPAQVHEECLTGLNAWGATIYPTPVGWAATFDPDLVERMGRQIGDLMARLGIHQGLAPVLAQQYSQSLRRLQEARPELCIVITESNRSLLKDMPTETLVLERGELKRGEAAAAAVH